MPIIVKFKNGQYEVIQGETDRDWELANRQGKVYATMMNGHGAIIYREDVRGVEFISNAEWTKTQEEHKKAEEEKAAAEAKRLENLAAAKEQAKAQIKKDEAAAIKVKYEAWHAQAWWRKLGRKCPVELPAEGV